MPAQVNRVLAGNFDARPQGYVPESRFGEWFQRTDIWRRYVLTEAVAELQALLPPERRSFERVLDAGCGEGVAFEFLQREFDARSIIGVDAEPGTLALAAELAQRSGGAIETRLADACHLPIESGSVDLVFCHQLLHHAADPVKVLLEFRRVLARDGWLLVAESCKAFIEWWPVRLLFRHPDREQHTAAGFAGLVRAAGFVVGPAGMSTPAPWWSQPDLGLWQRVSSRAMTREATQVRIAARRP